MNRTIHKAQDMDVRGILDALRRGETVICASCGTPVVHVSPGGNPSGLNVPPGIYCGNDLNHLEIRFNLGMPEGFWEKFAKKMDTDSTDKKDSTGPTSSLTETPGEHGCHPK